MSVDRAEVRRIARLAKLRFDDDEADRLAEEMTRILEHAERLRGLADEGDAGAPSDDDPAATAAHAPPTGDGTDTDSVRRSAADADDPDPLHGDLTDLAPSMRDGFFVVPPPPGVTDPDGRPSA